MSTPPTDRQHRQPSRIKLAAEIEAFLDRTGIAPTPFGLMAARDDKLLWRIRNARYGISLDKADRIRLFMRTYDQAIRGGTAPGKAIERAKAAVADPDESTDYGHQPRYRQQKASPGRPRSGPLRNPTPSRACPTES